FRRHEIGFACRVAAAETAQQIGADRRHQVVTPKAAAGFQRVDTKALPTPGQILAEMSQNRVGGEAYDREWPERARQSLW
ncbi:MAG TPA: hypothetical protein VHW71_17330, partial [Steroidobacteraceae bacterium]|nr:hypothetical protein [Steroidobacteraceae bacterium]